MKSVQGLNDCPLDPQDVSNEKAKDLIPAVLYKFIQWLTSSERKFDAEVDLSDGLLKTQVHQTERSALSICQDLMFANSSGEKKCQNMLGLLLQFTTFGERKTWLLCLIVMVIV